MGSRPGWAADAAPMPVAKLAGGDETLGRNQLFDASWRFFRGDAPGAEQADFNDAHWQTRDLPHDWSIED